MNEIIRGSNTLLPNGYAQWRKDIEHLIDTAKLHTALNVNVGTLTLYWNIGKSILQKQEQEGWGKQVIEQLSKDLISRYPDDRGYSVRNLRYMKRFASAYPDFPILQVPLAELKELPILQATLAELENEGREFVQVPLAQISWYHHISLLPKVKDKAERAYYITETAQNGWSRDISMQKVMQSTTLSRHYHLLNQTWLATYSKTLIISRSSEQSHCKMNWILKSH